MRIAATPCAVTWQDRHSSASAGGPAMPRSRAIARDASFERVSKARRCGPRSQTAYWFPMSSFL